MIWIVLAAGLILRLISLNQSLWLDEAINIMASQKFSFWGMLTQYSTADFHPPGYFAVIWLWTRFFGFSEISVRLPSVLFGVLTIYLIYLIGKKLVSEEVGFISAILLAVNPLHIYYSQEARMYSLAALAVSLNMFFFIKLMKGEKVNAGYTTLSNLLVLFSDYVAYLIFPAQFLIILINNQFKYLKRWFIYIFVSLAVFSWWLPVFLKQLNIGSAVSSNLPAWKEIVGAAGLKPLVLTYVKFIIGRISFVDPLVYASIFLPIGLLFIFMLLRGLKYSDNLLRKIVISWLLLPIILASLISLVVPVYSYFRLLFILPGFLIPVAIGINSFNLRLKWIFLSLFITVELVFSATYLLNPQFQREDWRSLVNFLKSQPKESKMLFESSGSFSPFDYYAGGILKGIGGLKNFPAKSEEDVIDVKVAVNGATDIYLIDYLVEISDPDRLVQKQITQLNYKQTDIKNFNGVGFIYHFVKND